MADISQATFSDIRAEIVNYLSSDPTFKSYNFQAPALALLIDALAYTSHYLVRYANFSITECFLDSAQLRKNVVAQARQIGYFPHQYTTSKAKLRLTVDSDVDMTNNVIIPIDTVFTASGEENNTSYVFRTVESSKFVKNDDGEWYADIDVIEGSWVTEKYTQDEFYTTRYYLINENVDTDYMSVIVYENEKDTVGEEWTPIKDMSSFGYDQKIYFLQEAYNGKIEIYFGDGKIAKKLSPNNVIQIKYLVTNGDKANNLLSFNMASTITFKRNITTSITLSSANLTVSVLDIPLTGATREDIESIRYTAPKFYQAQDRAVTPQDYNALIKNKFGGWIDSIAIWGGEDNIPPKYGYCYICIKPKYSTTISPVQKETIQEFLAKKKLPCIEPELVEPNYIDIKVTLSIDWWAYKTSKTKAQIEELIKDAVVNYFKGNFTTFETKFRYSKFLNDISNIDESIDGILTDFRLIQYIEPDQKIATTYELHFLNPIEEGSLVIGPWSVANSVYSYSMYDKEGIVYLSESSNSINKISEVGTIDYDTGDISIKNYKFGVIYSTNLGTTIPVVVAPRVQNITLSKNYLLNFDEDTSLTININENT